MARTIQTYRATRDGLKVGDTVRNFHDLIPEAADWSNLAVWIREGHVEPYAASGEEMEDHRKKYPEKSAKKKVVVKKAAPAKKKRIVRKKKGNSDVGNSGRELSEQSV